jgi:signal peptidase I
MTAPEKWTTWSSWEIGPRPCDLAGPIVGLPLRAWTGSKVPLADRPTLVQTSKILRSLYLGVWFVLVPLLLAWVAVDVMRAPEAIELPGVINKLRWFIRDQYVPALIVFFTVFEMLLYHFRHQLPFARRLGIGGRPDVPRDLRREFDQAQQLLDEAARVIKKNEKSLGRLLPTEARDELGEVLEGLREQVEKERFDARGFEQALERASRLVTKYLGRWRKSEIREYLESVVVAIAVALLLRAFVVEAFKIPSGSMLPTLQIQDHIFVNKLAYGPPVPFTQFRISSNLPPDRGDIMVFEFPDTNPHNPRQDFIKRVIALPGDTLTVESGHPVINGWRVPNCEVGPYEFSEGEESFTKRGLLYVEFLGKYAYLTLYENDRDTQGRQGPYAVAAGEVWVLGDNRNNSSDSRAWNAGRGGGVPFGLIKGRAMFVWMSFHADGGINPSRLLFNVMGKPGLPKGAPAALTSKIERCLAERPSVTLPPPSLVER